MAKITGATLAPIYERLNGAPSYHPLEADTFADWSVEAGDIVTITRDGNSYDSPVHNSTMTWRKGQKIAISSTGNEKRDSVAKLSQKKYNRGSSGIRNSQGFHVRVAKTEADLVVAEARIDVNEESIALEVTRATAAEGELSGRLTVQADRITAEVTRATAAEGELSGRLTVQADRITAEVTRATAAEGDLSGRLTVTAEAITAEVTRATAAEGVLSGRLTVQADRITAEVTRATAAEGELSGRLTVTAEAITAEVTRATGAESGLSSSINVEAGRISLVVEGTGANAKIKAASIVASINDEDESEVHIDSDHVYIGNQKSTTVINGKLSASDITTDYLDAKISSMSVVHVKSIQGSGTGSNISLSTVTAQSNLYVGTGANSVELVSAGITTAIKSLQITLDGNTYKLQKKSLTDSDWVDVGTFSRATTLSGAWSGSTYTVTASPQGNSKSTTIYIATEGGGASPQWDDSVFHTTPGDVANRITQMRHWLQVDASNDRAIVRKDASDGAIVTQVSLSTYKQTAYNSGYDASHSMFIADSSSTAVTSKSIGPGESVELWPGFTKTDGSTKQWGTSVTVTATNPYPSWKTLKCTGARTDSGLTTYTFTYQNTNSGMFSSNTNYTFHHNSGYT